MLEYAFSVERLNQWEFLVPPKDSASFKGVTAHEASTLPEFVDAFVSFRLPGFYARGEPREYENPWTPGIWRDGHEFTDRTPVSGPDGFYTQGELDAVRQCQEDLRSGALDDTYFTSFHQNINEPIAIDSIDLLHWSALAQHYNENQRYPTRLLDVTTDALVALFFAVNTEPDRNGFVFWATGNCNDLSNEPDCDTAGVYLDVLRVRAADGIEYRPDDNTLNFMRPPLPNKRLAAQRGAFLWTREVGASYRRGGLILRIPAKAKPDLAKSLEALNYSTETMFPI